MRNDVPAAKTRRTAFSSLLGAPDVSAARPLRPGVSTMKATLKLLYPLDEFYVQAGRALPTVARIAPHEVPEPYRQLLVHTNDMTPTLEKFHGARISIRVMEKRQQAHEYARQVVLTLNGSEHPIEFGAIVIHLQHLPGGAREQILEGKRPLGSILASNRIEHKSKPEAFIRVTSDAVMESALELEGRHELYGRRNVLSDRKGNTLADVVEILPPLSAL